MKHILPKGIYYIGDPCYVFGIDSWAELLKKANYFRNLEVVEFEGKKLFAGSTAYGDGFYPSNIPHSFPVDAGMIGAIPVELIDADSDFWRKAGVVHGFSESFIVEAKTDGTIKIGDIEIYTGYEEDDDEEDYDDCF